MKKQSKKLVWNPLQEVEFIQTTTETASTKPPRSTWTPEAKAKARERIHIQKPWTKSTGPRSAKGKCVAKMNAVKDGRWSAPCRNRTRYLPQPGKPNLKRVAVNRSQHGTQLKFDYNKEKV